MGAFNIEMLYLLTLHGVLYDSYSMKRNKGVAYTLTILKNAYSLFFA